MTSDFSVTVPAVGPFSSRILLVGKAPASEEIAAGRPHVGRAGREQRLIFARNGLSTHNIRMTNLCRRFVAPSVPLSKELTRDEYDYWSRDLLAEVEATRPRLIIAVGLDAARFFLGKSATISTVHGIPHKPGALDPSVAYRAPADCCIMPITQAAAGFHSSDARALIEWDHREVVRMAGLIAQGLPVDYREDKWAGRSEYRDVTGTELAGILLSGGGGDVPPLLAIDTEGTPSDRFSWQICINEGQAYMLRNDQPDFARGVAAVRECADRGSAITGHNISMYDLRMVGLDGLDLFHAHVHDTLFDNYLFCLEPLGLKPSAWRTLGMKMRSHTETVGELGRELQLDWLRRVVDHTKKWLAPGELWKLDNSGTWKVTWKPQPIWRRAQSIIDACGGGEVDADDEDTDLSVDDSTGNSDSESDDAPESAVNSEEEKIAGVDPLARWRKVAESMPDLCRKVAREIGQIPHGTMRAVWERDPEAALIYSCDDAHASYRLYTPYLRRLEREGKLDLAREFSANMHVYAEMQANGMPCSRRALESVRDRMTESMIEIVTGISTKYCDGQPFNPKSPPQVNRLFDRLGIRGTKRNRPNAKGKRSMSTGKKSIEHLRFIDDDMSAREKHRRGLVVEIFKWRSAQHTRDTYAKSALRLLDDGMTEPEDMDDSAWSHGQIKPWGTTTRRCAMARPNLLAQPKHSIYGKMIRDCYIAPDGWVFVESDLSSIEVCVMAHLSRGPELIAAIQRGQFHKQTASRLFSIPIAEVTDEQKTVGKRAFFGPIYGQSGPGLREQLWMQNLVQYTDDDCQDFIDRIKYEIYPSVGRFEELTAHELRHGTPTCLGGRVRSMSGMERYLPGIWSEDKSVVAEAIRQAVNHRVQGSAQDLLQRSVRSRLKNRIWEMREVEGVGVMWLLTVHDSLVLLSREQDAAYVMEEVERGLVEYCGYKLMDGIEVKAESKTSKTWGGL